MSRAAANLVLALLTKRCHFGLASESWSRVIVSAHVSLMPSVSSAEHPIKHIEKAINMSFLLMLEYHGESLLPLLAHTVSELT